MRRAGDNANDMFMPPADAAVAAYDEDAQLMLLGDGHSSLSRGCAARESGIDGLAPGARAAGGSAGQLHAKRCVAVVSESCGTGAGVGARVGDTVGVGVGCGVGGGVGAFVNKWPVLHWHSGWLEAFAETDAGCAAAAARTK